MTNHPILFKIKFTNAKWFIKGHLLENSYARKAKA